jgi:hypothetical protein
VINIGDAISPRTRQRLARLGQPEGPDPDELAQVAKAAAEESSGPGRSAWIAVALAIGVARTTDGAALVLDEILEPGPLQTLAQACLRSLCSDTAEEER